MVLQERVCNTCGYCWDCPSMPGHELCPECGAQSRLTCCHLNGIVTGTPYSEEVNRDYRRWNPRTGKAEE